MTSGFKATDEEHRLATQILVITHCHEAGALSSEAAIDIFKRSGLSFTILRDIWNIADRNGNGVLSLDELAVAIRLMGWVQTGEALDDGLLLKAGPLPTMEGITDVVRKLASSSSHAQQFPPLSPDDLRHYKRVFISAGPVNGRLDGDKVMNSFMTSNLSYEELSEIKKLIGKTERGSLDLREFSLGMYLIQALQSCLISSVPTSVPPQLLDQFPDLQSGDLDNSSRRLSRANMSTPSLRPSASRPHLSPMSSSSKSVPTMDQPLDLTWAILPHEKAEADQHFAELDVERKGYVDGEPVGRFFLSYGLPPEDLQQIWQLANLNKDNRLTPEGFAIALHLIRQRSAGAEIPRSLPSSLVPPPRPAVSRRTSVVSPTSPTLSAMAKSKPPPPPPPKRDRTSSIRAPNGIPTLTTSLRIPSASTSPNPKYTVPLSVPVSPIPPTPRIHSRTPLSAPSMSMMNIPSPNSSNSEVRSPFDDSASTPLSPPSPHPALSPQPRPPDNANAEALEEFKKETARLSAQVDSLLGQLTARNRLRDSNENLRNENDNLKSQLREMERTVSEVLSATDLNGSKDEYIQQVDRLTAEMAGKDSQIENLERMLAVVTQDERELRDTLRDSQQVAIKAKNEVEALKSTIATQTEEITELKSRLTDMGKAMSEPSTSANNRELRVLIRDVTKENDQLKGRLRDTEKSMEQLLLSSKFHSRTDEVERENKRLKQHVQELEMIAAQLQSQSHSSSSSRNSTLSPSIPLSTYPALNGRSTSLQSAASNSSSSSLPTTRGVESLTRENDQLKAQLSEGQRKLEQLRTMMQGKIAELQLKTENLTRENTRLKIDAGNSRGMSLSQEDNSVPPPAYDDAFVIPP